MRGVTLGRLRSSSWRGAPGAESERVSDNSRCLP